MRVWYKAEAAIDTLGFILVELGNSPVPLESLCLLTYMADRKALLDGQQSVSTCSVLHTRTGPAPTEMLLSLENGYGQWSEFFGVAQRTVSLKRHPPLDNLSRYETRILRQVCQASWSFGFHLSWLQRVFPEWESDKIGESLALEDILKAHSVPEELISVYEEDAEFGYRLSETLVQMSAERV